jgi:hypothetical protein
MVACNSTSQIVQYRVKYKAESSGMPHNTVNETREEISLTGLVPYTLYSVEVAAMNEEGEFGPYSPSITVETFEDIPGPVAKLSASSTLSKIYLSWLAPVLPNGVIIAYEVSYRPADNSGHELSLNTTDVESNFTAGNDLEGGSDYIFSVRAYTRVGPGTTSSLRTSTLLQLGTAIDIVVTVGIVASFVTALFLIYIAVIMLYIYKRSRNRTKKQDKSYQSATASNLLSLPYTGTPDTNASRDITSALKVTQISEEDEDYEDISFDSYDAEAVEEISPIYETIFDSKMTNLVCPVPADEFGDYVTRCHSNQNNDFKAQFASLQQYDEEVPKTLRKSKLNRFSKITVYEDNRVILKPIRGHSDYEEDFINASYIDGYKKEQQYIATQGINYNSARHSLVFVCYRTTA